RQFAQTIAFNASQQRERRRSRGPLKRKVVVARTVATTAARRESYPGPDPVSHRGPAVVLIARQVQRPDERERPDELLGHAAWKVDDSVVPEVPIEAAVSRAVRISI